MERRTTTQEESICLTRHAGRRWCTIHGSVKISSGTTRHQQLSKLLTIMKGIIANSLSLVAFASAQLMLPWMNGTQPAVPSGVPGQAVSGHENSSNIQCPMAFGQFCLDDATLVDCTNFVGVIISCGDLLQNFPPTTLRAGFCYQPDLAKNAACGKNHYIYPNDAAPFSLNTTPHNYPPPRPPPIGLRMSSSQNITQTSMSQTTISQTTMSQTTMSQTTMSQTTMSQTTMSPTTMSPTTMSPTTMSPTTMSPTTMSPTTMSPTTMSPTTTSPTSMPQILTPHPFTSHMFPLYSPTGIPEVPEYGPLEGENTGVGAENYGENEPVFLFPGVAAEPGPVIIQNIPPEIFDEPPVRKRSLKYVMRKRDGSKGDNDNKDGKDDSEDESESKRAKDEDEDELDVVMDKVEEVANVFDDNDSSDDEEVKNEENEALRAEEAEKAQSGSASSIPVGSLGVAALLMAGVLIF